MKTFKMAIVSSSFALGLLLTAAGQTTPGDNDPAPEEVLPPVAVEEQTFEPEAAHETDLAPEPDSEWPAAQEDIVAEPAPAEPVPRTQPAPRPSTRRPAPPSLPTPPPGGPGTNGDGELRLNFRNAPLESVLNYLSDAAGFIIFPKTEIKGKVTVWSNQPVTREEALDLLNSALDQNGYAAVRNNRTLTIWPKEDAKKQDLPVRTGNRPEDIPRNDEMVTQILPVRFISAVQVARDLQPLLPEKATMTANEGGNSLIITDTQTSIRRMAQIIRALDTAISSVSAVRVFPLHYADSKAVATVIKDLFASQETARGATQQGGQNRFLNMMQGRGQGGGGPGGAQAAGAAASAGGGRAPTPRVIAVAEERSNSVVVSAPDEQMPIIEELVDQIDTDVEDVTELRVFRLRYADAQETADLLANLFADSTSNAAQGGRGQIQFGGRLPGAFAGARGGANAAADQSTRMLRQSRVVAVPDLRTSSVVVSAARELMVQIARMIEELDADPARKQEVFVFDVQNTDPQAVQDILQSLFPAPAYGNTGAARGNTRNQNAAGSQLNNRANQTRNQGTGRTGNTGFGNTGGGFGGGSGFGTGR